MVECNAFLKSEHSHKLLGYFVERFMLCRNSSSFIDEYLLLCKVMEAFFVIYLGGEKDAANTHNS